MLHYVTIPNFAKSMNYLIKSSEKFPRFGPGAYPRPWIRVALQSDLHAAFGAAGDRKQRIDEASDLSGKNYMQIYDIIHIYI